MVRRAADDCQRSFEVLRSCYAYQFETDGTDCCYSYRKKFYTKTTRVGNATTVLPTDNYWWNTYSEARVPVAKQNFGASDHVLKLAVNLSVKNPIPYENDLPINLKYSMWTDGQYRQ